MPNDLVLPAVVAGDRVRLRKAVAADVDGIVETHTDPEVRRHLGGARPEELVRALIARTGPAALTGPPGSYVVADSGTDQVLGTVLLDRRQPDLPGHVVPGAEELELSYVLLKRAWGHGVAFDAARALLRIAAAALPDQPVLIVTQSANHRSLRLAARLGFEVVETFMQHGAAQSLAVAQLGSFLDI